MRKKLKKKDPTAAQMGNGEEAIVVGRRKIKWSPIPKTNLKCTKNPERISRVLAICICCVNRLILILQKIE